MSLSVESRRWLIALSAVLMLLLVVPAVPAESVSLTPIATIQGEGHVSPLAGGSSVTTSGIVTALAFNGYYVQDPIGDGNPATSEGLFVFHFGHGLSVGDEVELTDTGWGFQGREMRGRNNGCRRRSRR